MIVRSSSAIFSKRLCLPFLGVKRLQKQSDRWASHFALRQEQRQLHRANTLRQYHWIDSRTSKNPGSEMAGVPASEIFKWICLVPIVE